jgi:GNAT superfamily N-acetyltransferase
METEITFSENEDQDFSDFLQGRIREFNNAHSAHHLAIREPGAVTALSLKLAGPDGQVIGGLSGSTYWGWLYIDYLFVPDELRGRDLGSRLMAMAEQVAVERGCKHAYLTTFGFQAPRFYEKLGFEVAGRLEDYPPGVTYYWMKKDLQTADE